MSTPTASSATVENEVAPHSSRTDRKKTRDGLRKEKFRSKKSTETDTENKKQIYSKLYFGFKNISDAMSSMQIVIKPRAVILPITTRGIGFTIRTLIAKFARLGIRGVNHHQLCSSLYRVTLIMAEIKMMQSLQSVVTRNLGRRFRNIDIPIDFVRIIGELILITLLVRSNPSEPSTFHVYQ